VQSANHSQWIRIGQLRAPTKLPGHASSVAVGLGPTRASRAPVSGAAANAFGARLQQYARAPRFGDEKRAAII